MSALLLGGGVTVAKGSDRGGDFQNIPACRSPKQVGCVVAFSTFDAPCPPTAASAGRLIRTSRCCAPTRLTSPADQAPIDPINPTEPFAPGTIIAAAISLLGQPPITATTAWVEVRDAYQATCSSEGGANVLQITPLGAAPLLNAVPDATWGLHLVDANIALGDLLRLVHQQARHWHPHGHGHHH